MKFDAGNVVALVALIANLLVTLSTLRYQRSRSQQDRLWERRTAVYEEFLNWSVGTEKIIAERMASRRTRKLPPLSDPYSDDGIAMLNRVLMFASDEVRDACTEYYDAYCEWESAYIAWHGSRGRDEEAGSLRACARVTDLFSSKVAETIRREMLTGKPVRLRLSRQYLKELRG